MFFYWGLLDILFLMMFILGFSAFSLFFNHILSTLISLEFMALSIYFIFSSNPSLGNIEFIMSIFYLAIAVCEGAMGLSIIIMFSRLKGNEMFSNTTFLLY